MQGNDFVRMVGCLSRTIGITTHVCVTSVCLPLTMMFESVNSIHNVDSGGVLITSEHKRKFLFVLKWNKLRKF